MLLRRRCRAQASLAAELANPQRHITQAATVRAPNVAGILLEARDPPSGYGEIPADLLIGERASNRVGRVVKIGGDRVWNPGMTVLQSVRATFTK